MNDYKKLISAIRCSATSYSGCTADCPYRLLEETKSDFPVPADVVVDGVGYWVSCDCDKMSLDAADAIEQLAKDNNVLTKERDKLKLDLCEANDVIEYANDRFKKAEKERDAAISQICQGCDNCKYRDSKIGEPCISCSTYRIGGDFIKSKWEWRGVQ